MKRSALRAIGAVLSRGSVSAALVALRLLLLIPPDASTAVAFLGPAILTSPTTLRPSFGNARLGHHRLPAAPSEADIALITALLSTSGAKDDGENGELPPSEFKRAISTTSADPNRSILFSTLMTFYGAALGPFLDSYHSSFGVLKYDDPITSTLWGSTSNPALTTTWWVPELFGLAGFLIGWLYVLFDIFFDTEQRKRHPSWPLVLLGISYFTFQYWLSGVLYSIGLDRTSILVVMTALCAVGFALLDGSRAGFGTSLATAVGGPLIEVGLISSLAGGYGGYHYMDSGETGFFPLWIVPVYFLGGPAVGNLARGTWDSLSGSDSAEGDSGRGTAPTVVEWNFWGISPRSSGERRPSAPTCEACGDTRAVDCPNCDGGYYATYGQSVRCSCCKGRGLVICRRCFANYGDDPNDIENIRDIMSKIPD